MITPAQRAYVEERAYVPEHLPAYVGAISQAEPFLLDDFIIYRRQEQLIFVGYPLSEAFDEARLSRALDEAMGRFEPTVLSVTAPALPASLAGCTPAPPDRYYRLDLAELTISPKLRNMLSRAGRDVSVSPGRRFGREHQKLIDDFIRSRRLDRATQFIFKRIPDYVKSSTACIFEARAKNGSLVAFDVAAFAAGAYAFYLFNFRSGRGYVPGTSDLLLAHIVEQAKNEGKRYVNLGLGINPGVTFFKTKWGATPFLPHISCLRESARPASQMWLELFDKLQ